MPGNRSRNAQGSGTIRKKTVIRNGKTYTYWEARYTVGRDPGDGHQIQKSISGKTQKEVREKLQAINVKLNDGTYREQPRSTVGQWLDTWLSEYTGDIKPLTLSAYASQIYKNIKPYVGSVKLSVLSAVQIQKMYNDFQRRENNRLSAKSVKNIHGVLHRALNQAVKLGFIPANPSDACELPRVEKKEIKPLDEKEMVAFLEAIHGHKYERLYLIDLFTGMRQGEILGLSWSDVDFEKGYITVKKQLIRDKKSGEYYLGPLKNDKARRLTPAPTVMTALSEQRQAQKEMKEIQTGWDNPDDLIFTNEQGHHLVHMTVYKTFKAVAKKIGIPEARFHDLRHSYAVASLQAGDDLKTVQENLGHATATFTLDVYGHVTDKMKKDSADRMEGFIQGLKAK